MADPGFPIGGACTRWGGGGMDLRHGRFSVKMYAKTKELGPIGGWHAPGTPPPPGSANAFINHRLRGFTLFLFSCVSACCLFCAKLGNFAKNPWIGTKEPHKEMTRPHSLM